MKIWAISDPHLSFGVKNKNMDIFGPKWQSYTDKIKANWTKKIAPEDLVLIPGDISWASKPEDAVPDLQWLHELPGTKLLLKGNHDYWWGSLSKIKSILPSSMHVLQNDAFFWNGVAIGGARLWDTEEYNFDTFIDFQENPRGAQKKDLELDSQKIFQRELQRLEMSLKVLNPQAFLKIALTHYPPISADLKESETSKILEKYGISLCIFGHLHNVKSDAVLFGLKNGIKYILASCDYINFDPLLIFDCDTN